MSSSSPPATSPSPSPSPLPPSPSPVKLDDDGEDSSSVQLSNTPISTAPPPPPAPALLQDEVDVVISPSSSFSKLDFLETWRPFLQPYHLIIVQGGDPSRKIQVPEGYDYDLYNHHDICRILGDKSRCISVCHAAIRCFGFLVSKKKYIFTLDDDCYVAEDRNTGEKINPLAVHLENLTTPPSSFIPSKLYDRRVAGVTTVLSHGLWLNTPDYDPLSKGLADRTITVPRGTLFPMRAANLAFNREIIGPAMYFGLKGWNQTEYGYGIYWAGWCSEIICCHLNLAIKWGLPYIYKSTPCEPVEFFDLFNFGKPIKRGEAPPEPDWFKKLPDEMKETISKNGKNIPRPWQDVIVEFFRDFSFPPECTTARSCYKEIAMQWMKRYGRVESSVLGFGKEMMRWLEAWDDLSLPPPPPPRPSDDSGSSSGPAMNKDLSLT